MRLGLIVLGGWSNMLFTALHPLVASDAPKSVSRCEPRSLADDVTVSHARCVELLHFLSPATGSWRACESLHSRRYGHAVRKGYTCLICRSNSVIVGARRKTDFRTGGGVEMLRLRLRPALRERRAGSRRSTDLRYAQAPDAEQAEPCCRAVRTAW